MGELESMMVLHGTMGKDKSKKSREICLRRFQNAHVYDIT